MLPKNSCNKKQKAEIEATRLVMLEAVAEVKKHYEPKVQQSVVKDFLSQTAVVQTEIRQLRGNCNIRTNATDAVVEKDNVEVDGDTYPKNVYASLVKAHVDAEFTRLNQNIHRKSLYLDTQCCCKAEQRHIDTGVNTSGDISKNSNTAFQCENLKDG